MSQASMMICEDGVHPGGPYLEISEQPSEFCNFRYRSEMNGPETDKGPGKKRKFHGTLKGRSSATAKPTVRLNNYWGGGDEEGDKVFIRVTLHTADFKKHVHEIAFQEEGSNDWTVQSHADKSVSSLRNKAIFDKLVIIRKVESEWIAENESEHGQNHWDSLGPNQVRLGFCAYKRCGPENGYSLDIPICELVYSKLISNKRDATVGELKIDRLFPYSVKAGEELVLLVSKIPKTVRVRIFEGDANNPTWEKYQDPTYRHHQVAIIVLVPEFKEEFKEARLQVQLERTNADGSLSRSEEREIVYKPLRLPGKRKLPTSLSCSSVDQKLPRAIGESSSEESISVQRVQSCPNVGSESQERHEMIPQQFVHSQWTSSSIVQESNAELNIDGQAFSDLRIDGPTQWTDINTSFFSNNQSDVVTEEWQRTLKEFLEPSDEGNLPVGNFEFFPDLAPTIDNSKRKDDGNGKKKVYVETDSINNNNPSGSKPLQFKKEKSLKPFGSMQQAVNLSMLFQEAIVSNNVRKLEDILKCTQETELVNEIYAQGQTPIIIAVEENYIECVKLLCKSGANVNFADEDKNTVFHIAANKNHVECLEILLAHCVRDRKLDTKNAHGETAVHLAVLSINTKCVEMLLHAGANVNEKNGTAGLTPLHLAIQGGNIELVRLLLQQKHINIHEVNYEQKSAVELVRAHQDDVISAFKENVDIEEESTDEDE